MNDKDILEFEDRAYVSPTISRDEQLDFVENYRNVLNNNVQRVNTQTHNLGTDVPSNLGGLSGAEATFENRYVTPVANATVAELRAKAQETALTQSLNNLKEQMNKRYKDAYRNARISEYNKNNSGNGGGGDDESAIDFEEEGSDGTTGENKVELNPNTGEGEVEMTSEGHAKYTKNGQVYNIHDVGTGGERENIFKDQINPFKKYNDGDTVTASGVTYIYINNNQYPGKWFVVE